MKVRQICMMVLFGLGVIPAMQAQTFDKLWKEVEQAGKKSLPKTVIKLTDEIYRKGEKEKNCVNLGLYSDIYRCFFCWDDFKGCYQACMEHKVHSYLV